MSPKQDGFKAFVPDQIADLFGLRCRAMFGGYGLSQNQTFFGIIHKGRLYLKVNEITRSQYLDHGMKPFRVSPKRTLPAFFEVPVEVLEDADMLKTWAAQTLRFLRYSK